MRKPVRRYGATIAAIAAISGGLVTAGCGDNDEGATTEGATAPATGSVEAQLQDALDSATSSCSDAAQQISREAASNAAQAACDQLDSDLSSQLASAADEAQGDLNAALENLVSECRERASKLSAGENAALELCDALESSSEGG
jgi:hypothetical protein